MKSVLISIQPKWCELIASGKKTVEVRKTKPKLETPFKVYIYATEPKHKKDFGLCLDDGKVGLIYRWNYDYARRNKMPILSGKVIGEFVCHRIDTIGKRGVDNNFDYCYLSLNQFGNDDIEIEITDIKKSRISKAELNAYGFNSRYLYAWHISDLVIYDKPKELREFITPTNCNSIIAKKMMCNTCCLSAEFCSKKPKRITRPPQSWCYVEEVGR